MMRKSLLTKSALLVAAGLPTVWAVPSSAQEPSCTYDASSHTALIQTALGSPEENYFGQWTLSLLSDQIRFNGKPCEGATLTNTDTINVSGIAGPEAFYVNGLFAPGLSWEPEGQPEIEISVNLMNPGDILGLWGTDGDDQLTIGTLGVAVNSDADLDIAVHPEVSFILLSAGLGSDRVSPRREWSRRTESGQASVGHR
jgi:hypothetical protein